MPRKSWYVPLTAFAVLCLLVLACGGGAAGGTVSPSFATSTTSANTVTPAATTDSGGIIAGSLEIRGPGSYVDSFNYFHLIGEVFNGTEAPVTGIELMAHVADAEGQPAVDGDGRPIDGGVFSPLLYTLAPGESAPFDFFRLLPDGADATGWQVDVSVAKQEPAELLRAQVEVAYTRVSLNANGTTYLTGELVNLSNTSAEVSSFAGALMAADGRVLAANATSDYSGYLAAAGDPAGGDRTPFVIGIDAPLDAGLEATYYVDAAFVEPQAIASDISITVTNRFADEFDDLHLAAEVTNNSDAMLTIRLVAGLYSADGTVLDAASAAAPIYAAPGAVVPVTFEYFDSINRNADEQALVERVSVQVDPLWTYPIPYAVADLQTANEVKEPVGTAQYSFKGDVINSSEAELTSATLVLAIFDDTDNLVSSNWINIYPESETFKPGEALPFDMNVYLPTGVDVSAYTFSTIVQGYVNE